MNTGIAALLSAYGVATRVQSYRGAGNFLPLINAGELDFAAVASPEVVEAVHGAGHHEGKRQENVRIAANLTATFVGFFVRRNTPVREVRHLKGRRVTWGFLAQPTLVNQIQSPLANGGITGEDVVKIAAPSVVHGVDDFVAGRTEAGFFSLAAGGWWMPTGRSAASSSSR